MASEINDLAFLMFEIKSFKMKIPQNVISHQTWDVLEFSKKVLIKIFVYLFPRFKLFTKYVHPMTPKQFFEPS